MFVRSWMLSAGAALLVISHAALGQTLNHEHHHELVTTSSGKQMLAGGVDGSVNPELIPDSTAYRVFFRALTADADQQRQQAMLSRAKLDPPDLTAALAAGALFQQLRSAYIQHAKAAAGTAVDQAALLDQQTAMGTQVKSTLQSQLSPAGMGRLDALIQAEKRNMTIFPGPDMSGAR